MKYYFEKISWEICWYSKYYKCQIQGQVHMEEKKHPEYMIIEVSWNWVCISFLCYRDFLIKYLKEQHCVASEMQWKSQTNMASSTYHDVKQWKKYVYFRCQEINEINAVPLPAILPLSSHVMHRHDTQWVKECLEPSSKN